MKLMTWLPRCAWRRALDLVFGKPESMDYAPEWLRPNARPA